MPQHNPVTQWGGNTTIVNLDGVAGTTIYVSSEDPALTQPVQDGDIWIDTTP